VRENRTHGLTGGDWKRTAACGTAPVPDPPTSCALANRLYATKRGERLRSRAVR